MAIGRQAWLNFVLFFIPRNRVARSDGNYIFALVYLCVSTRMCLFGVCGYMCTCVYAHVCDVDVYMDTQARGAYLVSFVSLWLSL